MAFPCWGILNNENKTIFFYFKYLFNLQFIFGLRNEIELCLFVCLIYLFWARQPVSQHTLLDIKVLLGWHIIFIILWVMSELKVTNNNTT